MVKPFLSCIAIGKQRGKASCWSVVCGRGGHVLIVKFSFQSEYETVTASLGLSSLRTSQLLALHPPACLGWGSERRERCRTMLILIWQAVCYHCSHTVCGGSGSPAVYIVSSSEESHHPTILWWSGGYNIQLPCLHLIVTILVNNQNTDPYDGRVLFLLPIVFHLKQQTNTTMWWQLLHYSVQCNVWSAWWNILINIQHCSATWRDGEDWGLWILKRSEYIKSTLHFMH